MQGHIAEGGPCLVRTVLLRGYACHRVCATASADLRPPLRLSVAVLEALQARLGTLSLEAQSKLEADSAKKEAKAEAKAEAALKKKLVCNSSVREV